jgi:hypothetical protein
MEGFLFRRRKRGLAGPSFKRRWALLDSNNLIVYDGFDIKAGEPTHRKDSVSLNGIEWRLEKIKVSGYEHSFTLIHKTIDSIYLAFDDENQMVLWMEALEDVLYKRNPSAFDTKGPESYYRTLHLEDFMDNDENTLELDDLRHAYRHAERTLQMEGYGVEASATEMLMNSHRAKRAYYALYGKHFGGGDSSSSSSNRRAVLKYTVTIKKKETADGGSNLGFSLVESPETLRSMVHSVSPYIVMASSRHEIEKWDEISSINGVVVSAWPLKRVAQYLNGFRLPASTTVDIEFTRRAAPPAEDMDASYLFAHSLEESPSVYSYVYGCRKHAMGSGEGAPTPEDTANAAKGGDDEGNDPGGAARKAAERPSLSARMMSGMFGGGSSKKGSSDGDLPEEDENNENDDGDEGEERNNSFAAGGGAGSAASPLKSPRFSLFGAVMGAKQTASSDSTSNNGDSTGSSDAAQGGGSPGGSPNASKRRASFTDKLFSRPLPGDPVTDAAEQQQQPQQEMEQLKVAVNDLQEEVRALHEQVSSKSMRVESLERETEDQRRRIRQLNDSEDALGDRIAELNAEIELYRTGAKTAGNVAKVSGLHVDEKIRRLRERYGVTGE